MGDGPIRRVFISYQHNDQMKAKGFNLLRWAKNVPVNFVGRHLLDPVNSKNQDYIRAKIKEQICGTSVTIVLLGEDSCNSKYQPLEIEWSLQKDRPNGILAIRLDDTIELPYESEMAQLLREVGVEIIDWDPSLFDQAINRAAISAGRINGIRRNAGRSIRTCIR